MSTVGLYQPLIARDELVACLDRMTARRVTMISAPVGSGKTSLLRAWAERPAGDRRLAVVQVRRDALALVLDRGADLVAVAAGQRRDQQRPIHHQATHGLAPRSAASLGAAWRS